MSNTILLEHRLNGFWCLPLYLSPEGENGVLWKIEAEIENLVVGKVYHNLCSIKEKSNISV